MTLFQGLNSLRKSLVILTSRVFWIVFSLYVISLPSAYAQRWNGQSILRIHNFYRCMHGTQPLVWDNGLAASAQDWAYTRQAANCSMVHSGWSGIGENIAAGTFRGVNSSGNGFPTFLDVASAWYHEPFTYGDSVAQTNHFTQVTWQGTLRVGCAWAPCLANQWEFWVCQYSPPGNYYTAQACNDNVPPPCRQSSDCMAILQNEFSSRPATNKEFQPNVANPSSYNYAGNQCDSTGPYNATPGPICPCDSSANQGIHINITDPRDTNPGALTTYIKCATGQSISGGNGAVGCNNPGPSWAITGSCH